MQVFVNGEPTTVPPECSVADLLVILQLPLRFLAVERNLAVVPRAEHAQTRLTEGDRLEIVTLVGGG